MKVQKNTSKRLFSEMVHIYKTAAGSALKDLARGRGNLAVFHRDGALIVDFSVGSADCSDSLDREVGLAFYLSCALGHELFSDLGGAQEISSWLESRGINDAELARLCGLCDSGSDGDEYADALQTIEDAVLSHCTAIEKLRDELVADLQNDSRHHLEEIDGALQNWSDTQSEDQR